MTHSKAGGEFLARRNRATVAQLALPTIRDVLIIEDETFDADRLRATLHVIFGRSLGVRRAATIGSALDYVLEQPPELVFLDDYLKPNDTATLTIPFLRRAGYQGPIVVISGAVDRKRTAELKALGASECIHKDDLDSVRIQEALAHVFGEPSAA
ncbi:MAG: response regulator [Hyphomicrobiaceae bacterium]